MKSVSYAAGIIPYAICPYSNSNVYFLLGKEGNSPGWKPSTNKWCDFGGRSDFKEDKGSVEQTAAREFVEESLGVISFHPPVFREEISKEYQQTNKVFEELQKKSFTKKIIMTKQFDNKHVKFIYFLKQIPWKPELPHIFKEIRDQILKIKNLSKQYHDLCKKLPKESKFRVPGQSLEDDDVSKVVVDMCLKKSKKELMGVSTIVKYTLLSTSFHDPLECKDSREFWDSPEFLVIKQIIHVFSELKTAFQKLPDSLQKHDVFKVKYLSSSVNFFIDIHVKDQYLEKQCMEWWSLPKLSNALNNGGISHNEFLRPNFLPMVAILLKTFKYRGSPTSQTWEKKSKYDNNHPNKIMVLPWRSGSQKLNFR